MADLFVDVHLELNPDELRQVKDPARYAMELTRSIAEDKCAAGGGILRTDIAPQVIIGRGLKAVTGADTILVSSRWAVTVPAAVVEDLNRRTA